MQTDYIIVGQGICGTLLSYNLSKEGKKFIVIDESLPDSSSKVAGGIINPVTGKRMSSSWMFDELMPVATDTYRALEKELDISLLQQCAIIDFHPSTEQETVFTEAQSQNNYLSTIPGEDWEQYFRFYYGAGKVAPCWLADLQSLLPAWRERLKTHGALLEEYFDVNALVTEPGHIAYKGITAKRIIFCNGAYGFDNPYFSLLPFSKNKGEALIASIPGLPVNNIYKQGILKISPWNNGLFWIGSSFQWDFESASPTELFRKRTEEQLRQWLRLPFTIKDHISAVRPSTVGQQPFVGFHPLHPRIGILNGMGTKGCSLAPYFARQLTAHLLRNEPITPEADIKRFTRILSRDGTRTADN